VSHRFLLCAHNCRSIELRRSSRADIPLPDPLGCTGWKAAVPLSAELLTPWATQWTGLLAAAGSLSQSLNL